MKKILILLFISILSTNCAKLTELFNEFGIVEEIEQTITTTVSGKVRLKSSSGNFLNNHDGISVLLFKNSSFEKVTETDINGDYAFSIESTSNNLISSQKIKLPLGTYAIKFEKSGFEPVESEIPILKDTGTFSLNTFLVEETQLPTENDIAVEERNIFDDIVQNDEPTENLDIVQDVEEGNILDDIVQNEPTELQITENVLVTENIEDAVTANIEDAVSANNNTEPIYSSNQTFQAYTSMYSELSVTDYSKTISFVELEILSQTQELLYSKTASGNFLAEILSEPMVTTLSSNYDKLYCLTIYYSDSSLFEIQNTFYNFPLIVEIRRY